MSIDPSTTAEGVSPDRRILVDEDDGAEITSMSKPTFRRLADAGLFAPVKFPFKCRRRLYRLDDIRAAIAALPVADGGGDDGD